MTDFILRPIEPETDGAALAEIYAPSVLKAWVSFEVDPPSADEMTSRAQAILSRGLPYVVAQDPSGTIVGYAYASPYRSRPAYRHSVESSIYLAASAQGTGLAHRLMESLVLDCRRQGLKTMVAIVGLNPDIAVTDNQSVRFHQKFGFRLLGVLENIGHKFGQWTGTAVLQLSLDEI